MSSKKSTNLRLHGDLHSTRLTYFNSTQFIPTVSELGSMQTQMNSQRHLMSFRMFARISPNLQHSVPSQRHGLLLLGYVVEMPPPSQSPSFLFVFLHIKDGMTVVSTTITFYSIPTTRRTSIPPSPSHRPFCSLSLPSPDRIRRPSSDDVSTAHTVLEMTTTNPTPPPLLLFHLFCVSPLSRSREWKSPKDSS
mmetsp:Transcript_30926/g.65202  ORF Transcript_30926/g.65202 Transcript_30926/m.65202 type:complete len:193 (-) Transcript_30926:595-1173(-)